MDFLIQKVIAGPSSGLLLEKHLTKYLRFQNKIKIKKFITFLPASLLCKFIRRRGVFLISRASTKRRENSMPYFMSAEQPPHFQPSSWL